MWVQNQLWSVFLLWSEREPTQTPAAAACGLVGGSASRHAADHANGGRSSIDV